MTKDNGILMGIPSERQQGKTAAALRVLVLDDDSATREVTALYLVQSGFAVDVGEDGEKGWEALCSRDYDVLVTDNDMPRLTGIELVARLRQSGFTLPVIIATGSHNLEHSKDDPALDVETILHKPYPSDDLIAAVRHAGCLPSED